MSGRSMQELKVPQPEPGVERNKCRKACLLSAGFGLSYLAHEPPTEGMVPPTVGWTNPHQSTTQRPLPDTLMN